LTEFSSITKYAEEPLLGDRSGGREKQIPRGDDNQKGNGKAKRATAKAKAKGNGRSKKVMAGAWVRL
jgi:hypothetical protein